MFILWKNIKAVFFILVYLSFILILLSNILIVGMYFVMNGIPITLCFISVIWNICLNGLLRSLFYSIVLMGTRKSEFFHNLLMLSIVLMLVYWLFLQVLISSVGF